MHILNENVHILSSDEPSGLTMPFRVCVNDDYAILQSFRTLQEKHDPLFRFCIGSAGENVHIFENVHISTFLHFLKMCTFLHSGFGKCAHLKSLLVKDQSMDVGASRELNR